MMAARNNGVGDVPSAQTSAVGSLSPWHRLVLTGRLTVLEAEDRRVELLTALVGADRIELDGSGLEAVDVAGLQLLIAMRHSAEQAGKAVRLAGPPEGALRLALTAAGFMEETGGEAAGSYDRFWRGEG